MTDVKTLTTSVVGKDVGYLGILYTAGGNNTEKVATLKISQLYLVKLNIVLSYNSEIRIQEKCKPLFIQRLAWK